MTSGAMNLTKGVKLSLLTTSDVQNKTSEERKKALSSFAKSTGAFISSSYKDYNGNPTCYYWLRSA